MMKEYKIVVSCLRLLFCMVTSAREIGLPVVLKLSAACRFRRVSELCFVVSMLVRITHWMDSTSGERRGKWRVRGTWFRDTFAGLTAFRRELQC